MYPLKTSQKYNPANLAATANIYTTVYLGNYISGNFDENVGSHLGVDIIPMTSHDDVYACLAGTVVISKFSDWDGEYIVIEHPTAPSPTGNGTEKLYSCYLHLSERSVAVGDSVVEGQVIGKTGNTGNSTGEHLHFQIDKASAPYHAFWPYTNSEAQQHGWSFMEAVNNGLGIEKAREYTINPLVYLDNIENGTLKGTSSANTTNTTAEVAADTHTTTAEVLFTDVDPNSALNTALTALIKHGVVTRANAEFRPQDNISRVELLKMALSAASVPVGSDMTVNFTDLEAGAWYIPYVNTASAKKIVSGYEDKTFRPNAAVTRAEAAKIILSAFGTTVDDDTSLPPYADVAPNTWVAAYAQLVKDYNLIDCTGGQFLPDSPINRQQVALFIYRYLKK